MPAGLNPWPMVTSVACADVIFKEKLLSMGALTYVPELNMSNKTQDICQQSEYQGNVLFRNVLGCWVNLKTSHSNKNKIKKSEKTSEVVDKYGAYEEGQKTWVLSVF